jgi:hypothetical protein
MRTTFLHLADTALGYRDAGDPGVFERVAKQFGYAVNYAIEQRTAFVVFSGNLFHAADVEPDTFQVVLRGLRHLAEKNVSAIAVSGRHDRRPLTQTMSWHDMLAQEGLLLALDPEVGENQLSLTRWDRRGGMGAYADLGRCRVFGMRYFGSMSSTLLQAFASGVAGVDNREADFRIALLHGALEHYADVLAPKFSYSDVLMLRRHVDYVALGGCDHTYETEGWVYNPGPNGFYHVTVDTAVQPKHHARYVAYPSAMAVTRPAQEHAPLAGEVFEERLMQQLVESGTAASGNSGALRIVMDSMRRHDDPAAVNARLVELAGHSAGDRHAA